MRDCTVSLEQDLAEQFREKPHIRALLEAVGRQLNDLRVFFEDLRDKRSLQTAVGKQLDGIGDIVVLSRQEAGEMACMKEPVEVLDDETYRLYLYYKVWKNTSRCTYSDVMTALRMFWPYPIYYREDPEEPATLLLETGEMTGTVDTTPLFMSPLVRAAGVGLKVKAETAVPMDPAVLNVTGLLGGTVMTTYMPSIEREYDFSAEAGIRTQVFTILESGVGEPA